MGGDMGIAFSIEVFQVVPNLSQVVHPNIDLTLGKDTDAVRCRIFISDTSLHMKIYVLEIRGVDVDRIGRFGRILLIDPKEDSVASETDTALFERAVFRIFRVGNFDTTAEREQFRFLCEQLKTHYEDSNEFCVFAGNYNIGCELDALFIKKDAIISIEFKNYGGNVVATLLSRKSG